MYLPLIATYLIILVYTIYEDLLNDRYGWAVASLVTPLALIPRAIYLWVQSNKKPITPIELTRKDAHRTTPPTYDFKIVVPYDKWVELSWGCCQVRDIPLIINIDDITDLNDRESLITINVPLSDIEGDYPHCIYYPMRDFEEYDLTNSLNYCGYRLDDDSQDLAIGLMVQEMEG